MAEPENQTLRILREFREEFRAFRDAADGNFATLRSRMDNIWQALNGESILGRYAVAEVDERLEAIEKRLSDLEKAD
jgi:hypothetical protein